MRYRYLSVANQISVIVTAMIQVKTSGATAVSKVWSYLYTCYIVLAVHLDIVPYLTTQSFLRSFKQFSARRGLPQKMMSDNGKTFKATSKSLKKVVSHDELQQRLSGVRIEWLFNVEKAPWWGGLFPNSKLWQCNGGGEGIR